MTTIRASGVIGEDGMLKLQLPTSLPKGPVEAVIVIQPVSGDLRQVDVERRSGVFDGIDEVIDVEKTLRDARRGWESKR